MADEPTDEKPTNTEEFGCFTNPFPAPGEPAPKKGATPAPEATEE